MVIMAGQPLKNILAKCFPQKKRDELITSWLVNLLPNVTPRKIRVFIGGLIKGN